MATKLQFYSALADQTIADLTTGRGKWMQFLDTAARLYKYPFYDQMMIYAQRPDATACAEIELWNERFSRWVRRGAKGIALIDDSGSYLRLKYVFDVSDTEPSLSRARPVKLWEMRQEHKAPVLADLAKNYEDVGGTLADSFRSIAKQLASEYYEDNSREIMFRSENSVLEPPDDYDSGGAIIEQADDTALRAAFEEILSVSVAYSIMTRCGLDTLGYFDDEDFQSIVDFNTPDMVNVLGVATSDLSEQVLRDIEIVIRKYERQRAAERSEENYDRNPYLHASRGLSSPEPQTERTAEGGNGPAGQIRENEESVSQRTQGDNLQPPAFDGEPVSPPAGSGGSGDSETRTGDEHTDGAERVARQSARPDSMDSGDEHPESASGGTGSERTDLRVDPEPGESPPTFSQLGTSSISELLSTSPITMDEVDSILRDGANSNSSVLRIAARFTKGKTGQELADYLRREYLQGRYDLPENSSGKGFDFGNHRVCAWFDESGIQLAIGVTAQNNIHKVTIAWEQAAGRVNQLMLGGQYVDKSTFGTALDNELFELAKRLWHFYRDDMHVLPVEWNAEHGGHPEDVAIIKNLLDDIDERRAIIDRLESDVITWANGSGRSWHNPKRLLADLRDAMLPPLVMPDDNYRYTSNFTRFITQDEIDAHLTRGGSFSESKFRILSYFLGDHSDKERVGFLKNEYGHGGGTWSDGNGWIDHEPGKGITFKRDGSISKPNATITLTWHQAAKRIGLLISDGRYMTRSELDHIPAYERLTLARKIKNFFTDLPEEYVSPFADLDFYYPQEDEWNAIRDFDNPENVDALLTQMEPIYINTPEEDRYYNTRKAAWDSLNGYANGTYTLFPGIEKLPDPEGNAPVSSGVPQEPVQLSLFDVTPFPELPGADEQREIIDQTLRQEAAEIQTVSDNLQSDIDTLLLDIIDVNKQRIVEQFTGDPRSRAAMALFREIYQNTLPIPQSQAMKRIAELVAEGRFTHSPYRFLSLKELNRIAESLLEDNSTETFVTRPNPQRVDLIELWDKTGASQLCKYVQGANRKFVRDRLISMLEFEARFMPEDDLLPVPFPLTSREAALTGRPDGTVVVFQTIYPVAVPFVIDDVNGHELSRVDIRTTDNPPIDAQITAYASKKSALEALRIVGHNEFNIMRVRSLREPEQEAARDERTALYTVGDTAYLDNKPFIITGTNAISGAVELRDPSLLYPIFRIENKHNFARLLAMDERNNHFFMAEPGTNEPPTIAAAETPEPTPMVFDNIAQLILERVMSDEDYKAALAAAQSRGALRNPLTSVLTKIIYEHIQDEPQIYQSYLSDDDFSDRLYDFVYRHSWENRPQPATQEESPQFTEIFNPAEIAEIEAVFGDGDTEKTQIDNTHETPQQNTNDSFSGREDSEWRDAVNNRQRTNFRITDDHLGEGGAKAKFKANIEAIGIIKDIDIRGYDATAEEQEILSRYVGWGGLPQAFDPDNQQWEREYLTLNALLSPEEYESARASTLNAHYTSPTVIKAMWETVERLGFKSGNVLEPSMGIGNFFGLIPGEMWQSKLYGVELDQITAQIAAQLYPGVTIKQSGFENTDMPDAFFDISIGNVPFGDYGVADSRYDKHKFHIHDYFFAKSLDQVRPGGVIAFITSKYTLDKQDPKVRKYIAQRAELLGAVRLPNNAFLKNAGTETSTDIIFLQKRDRLLDIEPEWVHLGLTDDGIPANRYFLDNPEMLLGTMALDERMNKKYGRDDATTCLPIEGADLAQQLKTALSFIQGEYTVAELDDLDGVDNHAIPADSHVKNFSYALITPTEPDEADGKIYARKIGEGRVYFRENSLMYPVDLPVATLDRIKGMIGLRDCVQQLIALQLDEHSEAEIKAEQEKLNALYDSFIAEFGLINSQANNRAFNADSAYYLLSSLEMLNEDGELERKADMFTKRTIKQKTIITHVDTASEALAVSIGEKASVDLDYMSDLTGKSRETLIDELRGVIFLNVGADDSQEKAYVTADAYLSGNVREKLRLAEAAAVVNQSLSVNVEALQAIQPKDLEAGEIGVRLGATWIDPKYVQEFMYELLNTRNYNKPIYRVLYHPLTSEWQVTGKNKAQYSDFNATMSYGTGRMNAYQIIDDTLNLRDVRVYDYVEDADGHERRVLNKKETMLAQQKQELIKQSFKDWLWRDPERRQALVREYNEKFNSIRLREYDGSHLTFSGISPEIMLRPHQLNAIAHVLYGGNTLLAHEVGAGKTFEMVAAAMESKRLGLCQKSLVAVPKHLTEQWAGEFLRLYPSANILVATKKDFEMRNRKKFCAKIATGDYDAVIIAHSQLEKIPMSKERQERLIKEQIWEIEDGIRELQDSNGERFSIKRLEKTKRTLAMRLLKLLNNKRHDDVVTFEQLGVDRLFVDEAHNFKNLYLITKMRNVAGLSTTEAQKSSDLFMKCRYLDELTGSKGIVFATGTPVSNSMTEMYTMQRYLQYDTLEAMNLTHFDAWASIFGETVTSIELAPEGTGYRARTRFARFHNLPELMCLFKQVADIQTADMLNLPVPEATYENIIVEPSPLQQEMVQQLSERAADVHNRRVPPNVDNMLKITTDGRKIGLDQRLINPLLPDFEGSKVNVCTNKVFEIWNNTHAEHLTQLLFCDFSTPNKDGRFNIYDDIRSKLLERGIPAQEMAFIHDADTETRKKELFAKVRQGKVRVLFGSTFKMGSGTNVQDRLIAIHDADCPWRPSDLVQRSGRIIRQGNKNPEVKIFRYATSGTFDSYLWQTVQKKQEFISQIMTSKSPVRSCEDCDETALSYAEIKALCAGNPLIAEKMNLDNEVAKLRMLKAEHRSQHYRLEDSLLKHFPQQITAVTECITGIEKDMAMYTAAKEKGVDVQTVAGSASVTAKFPGMIIDGVMYTEKEPAAKALLGACKNMAGKYDTSVGEYMGFKLSLSFDHFSRQIKLLLRGAMTYQTELGDDMFGNMTRINNALDKLPERLEGAKSQLDNLCNQQETAKTELEKPFSQEAELAEKETRLALLNADLNIDGDGGMDVINDMDNDEQEQEQEPEADDFDEPEEQRTGTYNKSVKSSILDGLHNYNSAKKPHVQGVGKSAEIDI